MLRSLTPSLGVIALLTTSGSFALNIIFAVELFPAANPQRIPAIVASTLLLIDLGALPLSIFRNVRNHDENEKMIQARRTSFILLAALSVAWFFAVTVTLATLIWMQICLKDLPEHIFGSSTRSMLVAAFILCGAFALFQGTYLVLLGVEARRTAFRLNSLHPDTERSISMQQTQRPGPALGRYSVSTTSSPPSTSPSDRKRANSDTFSSIRSSLSQSIRPMTSKTRLLSRLPSTKSVMSTRSSSKEFRHAPPAIDTNLCTIPSYTAATPTAPVYDGFDTWDTSAVSLDSRQTISDSSPQSPFGTQLSPKPNSVTLPPFSVSVPPPVISHSHSRTFLPTIPASPVVSRTPSPAFALDPPFKPMSPRTRRRSRSESPANSFHSTKSIRRQGSLCAPPVITDPAEAHIHPLFRSDSPDPPPAVSTPGTNVRAAPNAGQMISESDRASLRRMRSDSLMGTPSVSSPLIHMGSFDSSTESEIRRQQMQLLDGANKKLQKVAERGRGRQSRSSSLRGDERDSTASDETERGVETRSFESEEDRETTPIPDWVLGAAPRNSMSGYKRRMLGSTAEEMENSRI